jgi:predicted metal-dependent hydrolase
MTSRHPSQLQLFEARESSERWTVRVSRRARRLSVRVYPGGRVEVVAPQGASPAMVQRFVGKHRQWIDERVEHLSIARGMLDQARPCVLELRGLGRKYWVEYQHEDGIPRVRLAGEGWLIVRGRLDRDDEIGPTLRNWVEAAAQHELAAELARVAVRTGLTFRRVQVRRQRTRWGSCSASGTISLNMCLLFQRPEVMRYLLIHELCHTRHMNHSRQFWALVESFEPRYRELDRELLQGWQHVPSWMFD